MLTRGQLFPHVSLRRLDGSTFAYDAIWQRRNLLLVALPGADVRAGTDAARYVADLDAQKPAFEECETSVVVTTESVAGITSPAVLIADRWGEIVAVHPSRDVRSLPAITELLDSVRAVDHACPECEGEAR